MKIQQTHVRAAAGAYDVFFGRGVLREDGEHIARLSDCSGPFVLSSRRVWRHCGGAVKKGLGRLGRCETILLDDRESAKTLTNVERICRQLLRAGADRRAVLVAVGGGVVGDVAGFVAASYLRVVALVLVPATLVGPQDHAIVWQNRLHLSYCDIYDGVIPLPTLCV